MTCDILPGSVVKKRRLYFTMVCHPLGAKRAGNAYATKQDARDAVPLVRGAWRGLHVTISQCTIIWRDGALTPKSVETLSRKYNLEPPSPSSGGVEVEDGAAKVLPARKSK